MRAACAMLCAACACVLAACSAQADADLAAAERHLLALMGLERRPERRQRAPAVPRAMRLLYEHSAAAAAAASPRGPADTVRSFEHTPSRVDERFPADRRFRLFFNVSGVPADETRRAADLVLQRSELGLAAGVGAQRLLVYDVVRPGRRGRDGPLLRLLDSVALRPGIDAVKADALAAARRWAVEPRHNYGLLVRVVDESGADAAAPHLRVRRRAAEPEEEWREARPLLLLYTEDARTRIAREARRSRRAAPAREGAPRRRQHRPHHRRKDAREACQKRQLYVDFADVGWSDWIVAPQGYDAYYCAGDCPFPLAEHLNGTNHAIVQTLVNSVNPAAVPKACCVPTQLASISMLYMDEMNNVVLKNYQDMAVVGCGCR